MLLRAEFKRVAQVSDSALYHDDLAEPNDPVYFREFVAHAGRHGLEFVTEAQLWASASVGVAPSMLRLFARIFEASVVQSQLRRGNGELRITIEPLQALRRKKFFWIPILNFASAPHLERARVEVCDAAATNVPIVADIPDPVLASIFSEGDGPHGGGGPGAGDLPGEAGECPVCGDHLTPELKRWEHRIWWRQFS